MLIACLSIGTPVGIVHAAKRESGHLKEKACISENLRPRSTPSMSVVQIERTCVVLLS